MKIDNYSKAVLTVIAAALVIIAAENLVRPSLAQTNIQKVAICDLTGQYCAGVRNNWTNVGGGLVVVDH